MFRTYVSKEHRLKITILKKLQNFVFTDLLQLIMSIIFLSTPSIINLLKQYKRNINTIQSRAINVLKITAEDFSSTAPTEILNHDESARMPFLQYPPL